MTLNQLFKNKPTIEIINELVSLYGLSDINDTKIFSKKDLENINTVDKLENMKDKLGEFYLPCKKKTYLNNITPKRAITILRQFLKIYNYTLKSKEKYIKSEKIIIYNIRPSKNKVSNKKPKNDGCVVSFD